MKAIKKVSAIILVAIMLFSMTNMSLIASADTTPVVESMTFKPITIEAGTNGHINYWEEGDAYFHYYWEDLLDYSVTLQGGDVIETTDYYVTIDDVNYWVDYEDNQEISHWEPGNTYQIDVSLLGCSATVEVTIENGSLDDIEIEPIEVIKNCEGGKNTDENGDEFFEYRWENQIRGKAWVNGESEPITFDGPGFYHNDEWYGFTTQDSQYYKHWQLGETNTAYIMVRGKVIEVPVTVIETPVESVTFEEIQLIENCDGGIDYDEEGQEYFSYSWVSETKCFIKFKNDDELYEVNDNYFNYNGHEYSIDYEDDQYENHWTVGNTYTATATILGYEADVNISIVESPIECLIIKPIKMFENSNGYWNEDEFGDQYYYYEWRHKLDYSVKFKGNDEFFDGTGDGFYYNDEYFYINNFDEQDVEHWEAGNIYNVEFNILGYDANTNVTIEESPIERITVSPLHLTVNKGGDYDYNEEGEYYRYWWENKLKYSIKFKDQDEELPVEGASFEYDGEWYNITSYDNQYGEPWALGGTYYPTINVMGYDVEVPVTIVESNIASFKVVPEEISFVDEKGGCWSSTPEGDWFYYYNWQDEVKIEVTLTDGTKITANAHDSGLSIDDDFYSINYNDPQFEEHWYRGNTYTINVFTDIGEAELKVNIVEKTVSGGFEYITQGDNAIITGCTSAENGVINVPSVIDGYTVIGITDLSYASGYATELIIPDSVTMISHDLFYGCNNLKKITLGNGIAEISNDLFSDCINLEEFVLSEDNPNYASVDGVIYDKDVTRIVTFPYGKTGEYVVPDTVTDVSLVFDNLSAYKVVINFGNSNTDYTVVEGVYYSKDMKTVYKCVTDETGTYTMPDTVEEIKTAAFSGCNYSEIIISENVTDIVYSAFSHSMELEKVVLPENLTSIGTCAFESCNNLTDIELPSNLEYIGESAFALSGVKNVTIPASVDLIDYNAYRYSQLSSITFEEGVSEIYSSAFMGTKLTSVKLPDSLEYLGSYAFAHTFLNEITFGSGLTEISAYTFENTEFTSITIPENIEYIGEEAFAYSKLKNVVFENEAVAIGDSAFIGCSIESLDIKEGTVSIGDYAFYENDLKTLELPESVTDITYYSFAENKNLLTIKVGDNLDSLSGTAFHGTAWYNAQPNGLVYLQDYLYGYKGTAPKFSEISIKNGTKLIADYAFGGQYNVEKVTIPSSVERIGESAFWFCDTLENVVINDGVKYIDTLAFAYDELLKSIVLPSSVEYIDYYAFEDSGLEHVWYIGDEEDLENLYIDWGNECLENATWHYIDSVDDTTCNECGAKRVAITKQPQSVNVECGKTASATVNVTGDGLTYKWYYKDKGSSAFALTNSFTSNTYSVQMNAARAGRQIYCVVTDKYGNRVTSNVVTLNSKHNFVWVIDKANNCSVAGSKHEECTVCKTKRNVNTVIPATGNHKFDNNCDKSCNVCGKTRTVGAHKYSNDADTSCNYCGAFAYPGGNVLYKDKDGKFYHVVNRKKVTDTLLMKHTNGKWYFVNKGVVDTAKTGLVKHTDGNHYYVVNGIKTSSTLLVKHTNGKYYYVQSGKVNTAKTGLVKHTDGKYYYVVNGVMSNSTLLVKHTNGKYYCVEGGKANTAKTGLVKHTDGNYYHVSNGIKTSSTLLVKHTNGKYYFVESGKVNTAKTGLVKHTDGNHYYVVNGIKSSSTLLVKHTNGKYYYVQSGKVNAAKTGLVKHTDGNYYYVSKGVKTSSTLLVKHTNGKYYFVQSGKVNAAKTGLVKHTDGKYYYVEKGVVNTAKNGRVKHTNGKYYTVKKGVVVQD